VAGFVGAAKGQSIIENSSSNGSAAGSASYAGGFAGVVYEESTIINCKAEGDVGVKTSYAGGFAGAVYGTSNVKRAFAYGNVTAKSYAGGLIGTIYDFSVLERSCAFGDVGLTGGYIAGGLVGEAAGASIIHTYAQGNVNGGTGTATGVGGLVGYFSLAGGNTINYSYSSGAVVGKGTAEYGAFSGMSGVTFLGYNYYDKSAAGVDRAIGTAGSPKGLPAAFPKGLDTDEMKLQDSFAGWDFVNIWRIDDGESYPYFDSWDSAL
jgi:hypothetical protein